MEWNISLSQLLSVVVAGMQKVMRRCGEWGEKWAVMDTEHLIVVSIYNKTFYPSKNISSTPTKTWFLFL